MQGVSRVSFQAILKKLKNAFDFGKWDVLDEKKPLTYCGGNVYLKNGEIELSYEQYIKKIIPITVPKGRKSESPLTSYEKNKGKRFAGRDSVARSSRSTITACISFDSSK